MVRNFTKSTVVLGLVLLSSNLESMAQSTTDVFSERQQQSSGTPATTPKPEAKTTDANAKTETPAKKQKTLGEKIKAAPIVTASFITGTVVGWPAALVRVPCQDAVDTAAALPLVGSSDNPAIVWGSRALVFPLCAVTGVMQAPFYSWHNSWRNAASAPFSKDALGVGKIDDQWE